MRAGSLSFLAELGQTEQALAEAGPLADRSRPPATSSTSSRARSSCGCSPNAATPRQGARSLETLLTAAREAGQPSDALAFAAAAQLLLAQRQPEQAQPLLRGTRAARPAAAPNSARRSRACCASRSPSTTLRSPSGSPTASSPHPGPRARARLSAGPTRRSRRHHADAARLYAEAAERWQEFGNVPERAYALLGQGRCLVALGEREPQSAARRGARPVRLDGLQARTRRDRSTARSCARRRVVSSNAAAAVQRQRAAAQVPAPPRPSPSIVTTATGPRSGGLDARL